jgi:hypothetical protein
MQYQREICASKEIKQMIKDDPLGVILKKKKKKANNPDNEKERATSQ